MNFESVRSIIDTYIKKNGVEAITGDILNNVLNTMLDDVDTAISSIEPSPGGGGGGTADLSNYYTKAESDARYLASSLLGSNTLIHSGNVGSYAMMWLGGANTGADVNSFSFAAGAFGVASASNSPTSTGYGAVLNIPYRVGLRNAPDFMGQLFIPNGDDADTNMYFRSSLADTWNPWRKIIATADDGYLYGLGGSIDIQYGDEINRYGGNLYLQHRGGSGAAGSGTGGTTTGHILMCAYGGNVLIGTAVDSGYKLDVNGSISAMSALRIGGCGTSYCGLYPNNQITSGGDSSKLWLYNDSGLVLYGTSLEIYPTTILYDKLGVGISSPTCALDVNGGIKATQPIFGYMYGTNNNAAAFIFDKPGLNYTGIGSDGVSDTIRLGACNADGTWVDGYAQKWKFYGDVIVSGDFSFGSDIRFKDVIKNKTLKIEHIAKAPLFTYKWNDRDDDTIYLGSSAQYWEKIAPWLVSGDDFKSLNYATLGVAMGISLAKKTINHEERIKILEAEIKRLKREQYGS